MHWRSKLSVRFFEILRPEDCTDDFTHDDWPAMQPAYVVKPSRISTRSLAPCCRGACSTTMKRMQFHTGIIFAAALVVASWFSIHTGTQSSLSTSQRVMTDYAF